MHCTNTRLVCFTFIPFDLQQISAAWWQCIVYKDGFIKQWAAVIIIIIKQENNEWRIVKD